MSQVLLLTKNILSNQELQEKLQQLNHEVWCTAQMVEQVQRFSTPPTLIQQFQTVIFGKTISDYETENLLEFFSRYPIAVLREAEILPSSEEQLKWQEQGLHDWILGKDSIINLREKLSQTNTAIMNSLETNNRVIPFYKEEEKKDLDNLHVRLTGRERKLMDALVKAEGESITRNDLCKAIWSESESPSKMSQLSCMVNRIKRKFQAQGIEGNVIVTQWGKGYQLSEAFYQQCIGQQQIYQ